MPREAPGTVLDIQDVVAIGAGGRHSLAVTRDGAVWAWGLGRFGALGDGLQATSYRPVRVTGLGDVIQVAAGWNHSLALDRAGRVWAWGDNEEGQVGMGDTGGVASSPVLVAGLPEVRSIAAGEYHSLALGWDGTVWSWGRNQFGELGVGVGDRSAQGTPVQVAVLNGVTALAARGTLNLALQGPVVRRLPAPRFGG